MNKKINLLELILTPVMMISCLTEENKLQNVDCVDINPLLVTNIVTDLTNYIDTIEVINFDAGDRRIDYDSYKKIIVLDNGDIILLLGTRIIKFDQNGKYICSFGDFGRGNGEYLKINDICLNVNETELWGLNSYNKILRYNLADGKYKGTINPVNNEYPLLETNAIIPSDNGLYLLSANEPSAYKYNKNHPYLSLYNFKGKLINSPLLWKDFNIDYPYSPYVSFSHGKYIIRPQENDNICYIVEGGVLKQFYRIHFGKKNIEPLFAFKNFSSPWDSLDELIKLDSYKNVMNIQLMDNKLYFSAIGPKHTQENYVINLDRMSGISWTHNLINTMPLFVIGSDKTYIYSIYYKYSNYALITQDDSPLLYYINNNVVINNNGDHIILKIKFK